ncbi:MAG TPA: formylmethanofuran dehydrogenase subunit E family protein [Candidatus Wallbacteria bacterium]|nr:formylmethanofuran dehydrogenase subunit E family protein [Candidatus Wallbacteria bacterium]
MNCQKCIYKSYLQYACSILILFLKSIRNIVSIKSASLKLIIYKQIFMARKYHSPLMPLAASMINGAMNRFPFLDRAHLKCIVETNSCLIDTVEKLTHCNRVNGKLKVFDYGRYALTFYDSEDLAGVRVFVDTQKLQKYSAYLYHYFIKSNQDIEFDNYKVFCEAAKKAEMVITFKKVTLSGSFHGRGTGMKKWGVCPICGESGHMLRAASSDEKHEICIACHESKLFQQD